MNQELLMPDEVATMYRVTRNTVLLWIKGGKLPALRLGSQYRIRRSDLDNFVQVVGCGAVEETPA
jgi:excisionase family DNA binding protein